MNIDKFKHQHADIMSNISALRRLAQAGVAQNAADIARLIVSSDGNRTWGTVGVSTNVIDASWQALVDSLDHFLMKQG